MLVFNCIIDLFVHDFFIEMSVGKRGVERPFLA